MNASSFIGQLSSTVLVGYLRVPTMLIIATFCGTIILFGMIGVQTVTGVVVFGVLYGYFAGICMFLSVVIGSYRPVDHFNVHFETNSRYHHGCACPRGH